MGAPLTDGGGGTIPTIWNERILKRNFHVVLGKMLQSEQEKPSETEEFYLRSANVRWEGVDVSDVKTMWFSSEEKRELLLQPGDLLVNEGGDVGRCAVWQGELERCYFQNAINRVRPRKSGDTRFLYYWLSNLKQAGFIDAIVARTTIAHLTAEKLERMPWPDVPEKEQRRISVYLDASCAAIDAAAAGKRRQLETLDALRKSVTHEAATKGLDASVRLKGSGVEWFDKIPDHWSVDRLKDVVATNKDAIKVGPFGSDLLLSEMADEGVRVYNQRTVIDRDFESGIHFISPDKYAEMRAFTIYPRDLLITTRGTIGRCVVVPQSAALGILHPCLMRVQTNPTRLLPEYLAVLIQDCGLVLRQLQMMSAATTIDVIYSDSLKRTYLPLPPVREQALILEHLDTRISEVKHIAAVIGAQMETLTAYRKSLIHECVTGKRRITESDLKQVGAHG